MDQYDVLGVARLSGISRQIRRHFCRLVNIAILKGGDVEERAGNYKEYSNHFNLGETHLRKIHAVMEEYAAKLEEDAYVSIYIDRENDSFYETRDLEKIFCDENTSGKEIKTLSMEIATKRQEGEQDSSQKRHEKALIAFTKDKDPKIRFLATYKSRDWCVLLVDELDTQVQRVLKEKPTSLLKAKVLDLVVALGLLTILMSGIAWNAVESQIDLAELLTKGMEQKIDFLVEQAANKHNSTSIWFLPGISVVMLISLFVLEFKPITKLVKASNTSVFYWGDVIPTYDSYIQRRARIKWGVIIAFIVSLVASLVGTWLT